MIKLIVGLGNPGKNYQEHRHNAGFWFVESLASLNDSKFTSQSKFFGEASDFSLNSNKVFLLKPQTFMNNSGGSIKSFLNYYDISPEETLVVHDELDLPVGVVKLKLGGGHGGHNGLRDIFEKVGTRKFLRMRIGVGHPGSKEMVSSWVLNKFHPTDKKYVDLAYDKFMSVLDMIFNNDFSEAQKSLHTK